MLPRSHRSRRIHPDCPAEMRREIDVTIAAGIAQKGIAAGETLADLVQRHCPGVYALASAQGFELRLDLAENTHTALCRGRVAYQIRRKPAH
jgi:hypothetical protein